MATELLKEGTKVFQGLDATYKNIDAVKDLSKITRTSMGPNGMNKMVVNRLGKLFVTNDASTILKELEVVHPAAKMIVLASEQQQQEHGDATNLVIVLAGELLAQAETLLRMGLHQSDIIRGFETALSHVPDILDKLVGENKIDASDDKPLCMDKVTNAIQSALSAKLHDYADIFAPLVAQACAQVTSKSNRKGFNVDNVRTAKILGGAIADAHVVKGMVITRGSEGTIKKVMNAKVAAYADGITTAKTDAKGTVYIEKADELEKYAKSEEDALEAKVKEIADAGVNLVVVGGTVHEMAMHFLEKYKIMVVKTPSKFELRRVCQAVRAEPLVRIAAPTPEQIGHVDECVVEEIGSTQCTIFRQVKEESAIATIVLRGATNNILDDIERALDDGISCYKGLVRDGRFVPGGGATEMELARQIRKIGESTPGQDQYAIKKFAEVFEVIPRTLAENAGMEATLVLSQLYAKHEAGETTVGVNVDEGVVGDTGILDLLTSKLSAIRLATDAAVTVLRISQIIMAKQAGVKLPGNRGGGTMGAMDQDAD